MRHHTQITGFNRITLEAKEAEFEGYSDEFKGNQFGCLGAQVADEATETDDDDFDFNNDETAGVIDDILCKARDRHQLVTRIM